MKTKQQDIICLSMTTWEGDYMKTIVHMMNHLAKNHRVLFVDYPFTLKDLITGLIGKSKAPWKRMIGWNPRLRKLQTKHGEVHHLTLPPILPTNWIQNPAGYKKMVAGQTSIIGHAIRKAMKQINFVDPIVINAFNPIIGLSLAGKLQESKLVYYCYDEIRAAAWCGKHGGYMEDEFIGLANEVIVTSEELLNTKSKKNPNTTLVKNGVDYELFHQAFHTHQNERKVIGYVGSIDFRLDFELLKSVISAKPNFDFHFVGRITDPKGKATLDSFPNVKFFGAQQPHEIPKFMEKFDAGLIPFAKNDFTKSIYPLKINEYLAAGLPVVSTDFATLNDFTHSVSIAGDVNSFITCLEKEITSDTPQKKSERIAIAQQNDWSSRAKQVEELLKKPVHAS